MRRRSRTMSELTPYICVADARAALAWYTGVLGAVVVGQPYVMDDNRIGHAELSFDGARLMLSDQYPEVNVQAPATDRGSPVSLHLSVADVDALAARVTGSGGDARPRAAEHGARPGCSFPRPVRPSLVPESGVGRHHRLTAARPTGAGGIGCGVVAGRLVNGSGCSPWRRAPTSPRRNVRSGQTRYRSRGVHRGAHF